MTMHAIRWKLFKLLSRLGWWVCPEPDKSNLTAVMPTWDDWDEFRRTRAFLEKEGG